MPMSRFIETISVVIAVLLVKTGTQNQLNSALIEGVGSCRARIHTDLGCEYSGNPAVIRLCSLLDR